MTDKEKVDLLKDALNKIVNAKIVKHYVAKKGVVLCVKEEDSVQIAKNAIEQVEK